MHKIENLGLITLFQYYSDVRVKLIGMRVIKGVHQLSRRLALIASHFIIKEMQVYGVNIHYHIHYSYSGRRRSHLP
jgi:hypothetical protein